MLIATSSQTIGPYWHLLEDTRLSDLTRFGAQGERIQLIGTISDGGGAPVTDACVELWQPSPPASEHWDGWGRCRTDESGTFRFTTLKPGPVPGAAGANAMQAPHVAITIFARGILYQLQTRAYFDGEAMNETDGLLSSLDPARRATLIAKRTGQGGEPAVWRLDINLQGPDETVFLEI